MEPITTTEKDVKKVFRNKGTCSNTFAYLLNREFGHNDAISEEQATDPLAGGIMQKGQQCGMLWGASLAAGKASYHKHSDTDQAMETAIKTTQNLMASFEARSHTVNCRDITKCNMDNFFGLTWYMMKTMIGGMDNSKCFNLAEDWAPEALEAARQGIGQEQRTTHSVRSCASEVVRKMGGTDEEAVMVSGFAGGLGLSGMGCGALSAAIWKRSLEWSHEHPGKSSFKNPRAKKIMKTFLEISNKQIRCQDICGKQFGSVQEHTEFIAQRGCERLIDVLSEG